jgi:hypothetical protein
MQYFDQQFYRTVGGFILILAVSLTLFGLLGFMQSDDSLCCADAPKGGEEVR